MNLLKAIGSIFEKRDAGFGTTDPRLLDMFGVTTAAAGIAVSPASAMRCTAVRCAVQAIAEGIGTLPIHVFERKPDGVRERATEHPAYSLLHDQPNDWTAASDFFEQGTRDALLHGNAFAFINRVDGRLRELTRIDPVGMSVERDERTGEPVYKLGQGASIRYIDRRDILHIKAPSIGGLAGDSPVQHAREAIALALAMEKHVAGLFGNGARPSGILTTNNRISGETALRLKASWEAAYGGSTKSGKTAVLEEDLKFTPLTFSSVDAQTLELWQHTIGEIARAFRVPPVLLMDYGRATWANSEEMGRQFVTFTLMRWIDAWQGELRLKLFTDDERGQFFAEFLLDDLLRADIGKRADAYGKLIAARILNPNEVRAMENRPPYDGGDVFANPNTTTTTTTSGPTPPGGDA